MHTVLYVGPSAEDGDGLGWLRREGARRRPNGAIVVRGPRMERAAFSVSTADGALRFLRENAVDVLVLDARPTDGARPAASGEVLALLAQLFPEGELHAGIQRARVLGLVGRDGGDVAFRMGTLRIGGVLSDPDEATLQARLDAMLADRVAGRIALCLAGGGIEGLFYEIGVLRALDAFLENRPVVDFDLFCGISAGALIGGMLANGVGPDEIGRGLAGGSTRLRPFRRRDLFDFNAREVRWRVGRLARELARGGAGPRGALSSVLRALPTSVFAGDRLREYIRSHLEQPGMSDRFDELRRPLFVGATDQDTSQAVVFGEEGFRHVPIHKAIRASVSLLPFYAPEEIDGRYYIDGAFTRTTNMRVAVRQGATMVILIDPLVPAFFDEPGQVYARGGLFAGMQGIKALVNGRFDKAVKAIREMFPDVSFYLFRPYGDEMKILSGSPMKYFYRREIEEVAYRNTIEKLRVSFHALQRDFQRHGVVFRDPEGAHLPREISPFEPLSLGVGL